MTNINARMIDCELKKGDAPRLILSLLGARPRHGYDIIKRIDHA
jgi:DNA-binding PadR family transcriptional regulator